MDDPHKRQVLELAFVRRLIDPSALQHEPDLTQTCWVKYGYMTPIARAEEFCHDYLVAYRRHYKKYWNHETADGLLPVAEELMLNEPGEISALWRARQHADAIGMAYPSYLNAVLEWANQRNRKRLPRPNQLYGDKQVEIAIEKASDQLVTLRLFAEDWDPRFFKQNPSMDPPKRRALVMRLVKLRQSTSPEYILASLMGADDVLTETQTTHMFRNQPDLLRRALTLVTEPRIARPAKEFEPYQPPCLGLRPDSSNAACSKCPFNDRCAKMAAVVEALVLKQTGSVEPLAVRKRELARLRKQRSRERAKALERDMLMAEAS